MPVSKSDDSDSDLLTSFVSGDTIFVQGDEGDDMYIVESGEVEIVRSFASSERQLAVLGPGDFFGEIAILEEMSRMATARALTDCRLLPIDPSTFDQLLRDHPEITVRVLRKLSRRLREIEEANQKAHEVAAGPLVADSKVGLEPVDIFALQSFTGAVAEAAKPAAAKPVAAKPAAAKPAAAKPAAAKPAAAKPAAAKPVTVDPRAFATHDLSEVEPLTTPAGAADPLLASLKETTGTAKRHEANVARLVHLKTGRDFPIKPGPKNLIGRFDPMTGKHPEIDLEELDTKRSMSRSHARIWLKSGVYYLREEVGVRNGTFCKSRRLNGGEDCEIHDGDRLRFGLVELVFQVIG